MSESRMPDPWPGEDAGPPRHRRARAVWEIAPEPFIGALVLADLETAAPDDAATILARFAVVRCMSTCGPDGRAPARERRAAMRYLQAVPEEAAQSLRALVARRQSPPATFYGALLAAARHAARRGHAGAACTFLRWASELARTVDDAVSPRCAQPYVAAMERSDGTGGGGYDARARRAIAERMARREPLVCPVCAAPLSVSDVRPPNVVSYVRRRVWVLCTGCRRTAALDVAEKGTE